MERNFLLPGLTSRHTPTDLTRTFEVLQTYMRSNGSNEYRPARKTSYSIPDVLNKGLELLLHPDAEVTTGVGGKESEDGEVQEEDVLGDL